MNKTNIKRNLPLVEEMYDFHHVDETFRCSGIYLIFNIKKNRYYIGSSKDIKKRIRRHVRELGGKSSHHSLFFRRDFAKSGIDNFKFAILEKVKITDLIKNEQRWLDQFSHSENCYNSYKIADRPTGYKPSKQTRRKLSLSNIKRYKNLEEREKTRKASLRVNQTEKMKLAHKKRSICSVKATQKSFKLLDPFGKLYSGVNISKFCRNKNLSCSAIIMVLNGKREHHKGWRRFSQKNLGTFYKKRKFTRKKSKIRIDKLAKSFSFLSPEKHVFKGKNIKNFCIEHDLNHSSMCALSRGDIKQYKGWTKYGKD